MEFGSEWEVERKGKSGAKTREPKVSSGFLLARLI